MKETTKDPGKLLRLLVMGIAALLITVTGILFSQSFFRILPLYVSLVVGLLQSRANRYASLLGGLNSLLYAAVYLYLGLYASAVYTLVFSFPVQIAIFYRWSKNRYGSSTVFRPMSPKARVLVGLGLVGAFLLVLWILKQAGSQHQVLDTLSSLLGSLITILTLLAYVEYTWLMLPSGLISIVLNVATMQNHPGQITYVIFSFYSLYCVTLQFFRVRSLYRQQQEERK